MNELWSFTTRYLPTAPADWLRLQLLIVLSVSLLVPLAGLFLTFWRDRLRKPGAG